jgi:pyruvate carboxylase
VDGFRREIYIEDEQTVQAHYRKQVKLASDNDPMQIGSPIPGNIVKIMAKKGDAVKKGQAVAVVEP